MSEVPHGTDIWWVDEGIAGQGPRPDYLQPQFKSLAEQARSYAEARKALGAQQGAPDRYELGELEQELDITNPHLQDFLTYAKEQKFSQDAVSKAVKSFVEYEKSMMPDETLEIQKLGPDGQQRRSIIDQWAKNTLSEDANKVFETMPKTAEVLKFMDELRQKSISSTSNPPMSSSHQSSFKPLTEAEVRQEMRENYEKYCNNPSYRGEIQRKLQQVMGTS